MLIAIFIALFILVTIKQSLEFILLYFGILLMVYFFIRLAFDLIFKK